MTQWSLESELCNISGESGLLPSLFSLGFLTAADQLIDVRVEKDWYRSGAESYLLKFVVETSRGLSTAILKAYTPSNLHGDLNARFCEITNRRIFLANNGILTPRLFAARKGVWIEEWLEKSITESLQEINGNEILGKRMAIELRNIAAVLDMNGFLARSIYEDLRVKNDLPYMIDFGEDLGAMSVSADPRYNQNRLLEWLKIDYPVLHALCNDVPAQVISYGRSNPL